VSWASACCVLHFVRAAVHDKRCGMHARAEQVADNFHFLACRWVEYFRLELTYAARLAARRRLLGVDEQGARSTAPTSCCISYTYQRQEGCIDHHVSALLWCRRRGFWRQRCT
jgi:hypothetical protein